MNFYKYVFSLLCILLLKSLEAQNLANGQPWYDVDGNLINAHGAGILFHNKTYYWFGEFKGEGKTGNLAFDGVSCYTSKDLLNWKNEGIVLKVVNDSSSMLQLGCIIERPKVIYNKTNPSLFQVRSKPRRSTPTRRSTVKRNDPSTTRANLPRNNPKSRNARSSRKSRKKTNK